MDPLAQLRHTLKNSKKVLVTSHIKPDGDAVSSALAMKKYLELNFEFEELDVAFSEEKGKAWKEFPFIEEIEWVGDIVDIVSNYDTLVLMDAHYADRFSRKPEELDFSKFVTICIDHHPGELEHFVLDLSDTNAVSATQLVYKYFYSADKSQVSKEIARLLMLGILSDSGTFKFVDAKSADTLLYAKELIEIGQLDIATLALVLEQISKASFEVTRLLIRNTQFVDLPDVPPFIYSYLPKETLEEFSREEIGSAGDNFKFSTLRQVEGYKWGFIVTPIDDTTYSVSFRSTAGAPVVNTLAKQLGGGGHLKAAAGRYKVESEDSITAEQICEKVIEIIKNFPLEIAQ